MDGESLLDAGTISLPLKIREEQKIRRIILTHAHFDHLRHHPDQPEGEKIAYAGDTGPTDRFWKKVDEYRVNHLIVESSFPNRLEELALKTGHLTPALLKKELAKMRNLPPKTDLIHAKPQYFPEIEQEIQSIARNTIRYLRQEEVLTI